MKAVLSLLFSLVVLCGCVPADSAIKNAMSKLGSFSKTYSKEEVEKISKVKILKIKRSSKHPFIIVEGLPSDKHIVVAGEVSGKYETKYGSRSKMLFDMKASAYSLGYDAIANIKEKSTYISMTDTTVVKGVGYGIKYVEPKKDVILSDLSLGLNGGLRFISASRFAKKYEGGSKIIKNMIYKLKEDDTFYIYSSDEFVAAFSAFVSCFEGESQDVALDYVAKNGKMSLYVLNMVKKYISGGHLDRIERFMKFHPDRSVRILSAKILIESGRRAVVEKYAQETKAKEIYSLLL